MPNVTEVLQRSLGRFTLEDVLSASVTLLVCLVAVRLVTKLFQRLLRRTKLEERFRRYVLMGVRLVLYTLTVVFVAGSLGIDMTSLVALLSVGSLGVTLAAEDVLGNVAGGLVILSSHPFTLEDFIEVDGISGTVEEIRLNHTRILTPDGLTALVPNKSLASSKVVNYTALGRRRSTWKLTASYRDSVETVKAACFQAIGEVEGVLKDPAPVVYLSAYGESGIEYTVFTWAAFDDFWTVHFALGEQLRAAFAAHGVEIPFRQLDVHILDGSKQKEPLP